MLKELPPFNRWTLPESSRLMFEITDHSSRFGDYSSAAKTIRVSLLRVQSFQGLLKTVAHEMIHVNQDFTGKWPKRNAHNAAFCKKAKQVCEIFNFDPGEF